MRQKVLPIYVAVVAISASAVLLLWDWVFLQHLSTTLGSLSSPAWVGWLALLALGILSEFLSVTVTVAKSSGASSIVFIPILASLLLFGAAPAALLALIAAVFGEILVRKKPPIRATFNISQYFLTSWIAGIVFENLGGVSFLEQVSLGGETVFHLLPFIGFIGTFILINNLFVSAAIALNQYAPFWQVWRQLVGESGTNIVYDIFISPIAIAVAFLYRDVGILGLAVIILPLLFIRHSYLVNHQLQAAIRDLLSALVKAIETRDPYTSGHSIRVANLAERIAGELGLSNSRIADCRSSALLHDIGKIDPIYTTILKKPDSLTPSERTVIESHVMKGVEFVNSLASFPPSVIAGIRHHHERVDGKGYPDQLTGTAIPIEARIIKVCDAIDAMLSDRPYRSALTLDEVYDQLNQFSGTQFDPVVVDIVLKTKLLEDHQSAIGERKPNSTPSSELEDVGLTAVVESKTI